MNDKSKVQISAITEVTAVGQKCIGAVLAYENEIDATSLNIDTYEVSDRRIVSIDVTGNKVTLHLSEDDEAAEVFHCGNPWQKKDAYLSDVLLEVKQVKEVRTVDGQLIPPMKDFVICEKVVDEVADQFIQGTFGKQKYNLFIPRDYDPSKKYPLIQFIHDAAVCGKDTRLAITQGLGSIIWVTADWQKTHPCFVFAPQFNGPPIVDDDWNVDKRLEDAKSALDYVIETYSIDTDRIYTTGQSMGCMSSIVLNVRYPNFFAGSILVAGQWDERKIPGLEKQNLWMICSQGDAKAFPIMNQMCVAMEQAGAKVARKVVDNNLSQDEYKKIFDELLKEEPNIIFTPYRLETVADGWHSNGGEHHINTWRTAYNIDYIREWLFNQKRKG